MPVFKDFFPGSENYLPRTKPLKYTSQKDIVLYAHLMKLDYFSTECKYAPDAFRGYVRHVTFFVCITLTAVVLNICLAFQHFHDYH